MCLVVDEITVVAIGGAALDVRRAPANAGNTAIRGAVETAVFVLHQPVQLGRQLPAHGRREQLAMAGDAVTEAVAVLIAHVQAQADGVRGVGAEVGIQAAQVFAAALCLERGAAPGFGRLADAVDDTALAATPVEHGCRPLEHFDALDVVQVAHVLAVVTHAVQIEVVAGIEATNAQAVETGIRPAADVGQAAERLAQIIGAIVQHIARLQCVDGLRHVTHRRGRAGGGTDLLDARVIGFLVDIAIDHGLRQVSRVGTGEAGCQ